MWDIVYGFVKYINVASFTMPRICFFHKFTILEKYSMMCAKRAKHNYIIEVSVLMNEIKSPFAQHLITMQMTPPRSMSFTTMLIHVKYRKSAYGIFSLVRTLNVFHNVWVCDKQYWLPFYISTTPKNGFIFILRSFNFSTYYILAMN